MINPAVKQICKFLLGPTGLPVYVAEGPIEQGIEVKVTSECGCTQRYKYYPSPLDRFVNDTHIPCDEHGNSTN